MNEFFVWRRLWFLADWKKLADKEVKNKHFHFIEVLHSYWKNETLNFDYDLIDVNYNSIVFKEEAEFWDLITFV